MKDLLRKYHSLHRAAAKLDGDYSDNAIMIREQIGLELELLEIEIRKARYEALTPDEQTAYIEKLRSSAVAFEMAYNKAVKFGTTEQTEAKEMKWQAEKIRCHIIDLTSQEVDDRESCPYCRKFECVCDPYNNI